MSIENDVYFYVHGTLSVNSENPSESSSDFIQSVECMLDCGMSGSAKLFPERAARIVECVNAFVGIPTNNVQYLIRAIKYIHESGEFYPLFDTSYLGEVHFRDCRCDQCTSMIKRG